MSEIVIRGSLEALQRQALALSNTLKTRASEGWAVFQADEVWFYETEMDERVCPVCEAFGRQHTFMGDTIPTVFPDYDFYARPGFYIVYPRVHRRDPKKFFYAPCRCRLIWQNTLECLERRLHEEKLGVLGT